MIGDNSKLEITTSKPQAQEKGFSLVEMIMATAIFALAFVAISAIFVAVSNAQNKSKATVQLLNEAQFVFEQITRDIRENMPMPAGNAACNCPGGANTYICLQDLTGQHVFYKALLGEIQVNKTTGACLGGPWYTLSDPSITVSDLNFYLSGGPNDQPLTRIYMKASNNDPNPKKAKTVEFQTAASSRIYAP